MNIVNRQGAKLAKKNKTNYKLMNRFSLALLASWRLERFSYD